MRHSLLAADLALRFLEEKREMRPSVFIPDSEDEEEDEDEEDEEDEAVARSASASWPTLPGRFPLP
jgi:hypothetical protein